MPDLAHRQAPTESGMKGGNKREKTLKWRSGVGSTEQPAMANIFSWLVLNYTQSPGALDEFAQDYVWDQVRPLSLN